MENREKLLTLLKSEIKSHRCNNYIVIFCSLLSCSEKESIELLRKYHISKKVYDTKLKMFSTKFPDYKEEQEYLKNIYQKYLDMYFFKTKEMKIKKMNVENQKILDSFLESNNTIEEFCSKYGYRMSLIFQIIYDLPVHQRNEIQSSLKNKNNDSLIEIMRQIVKEICLNPNFDIIDYYQYTHLKIYDFRIVLKEYFGELNPKITKKVVIFLNKYREFEKNIITKEKIINSNISIGNKNINLEEKQKILEFLESQNIPICFYNAALKKYIKNPEIFECDQKIKGK